MRHETLIILVPNSSKSVHTCATHKTRTAAWATFHSHAHKHHLSHTHVPPRSHRHLLLHTHDGQLPLTAGARVPASHCSRPLIARELTAPGIPPAPPRSALLWPAMSSTCRSSPRSIDRRLVLGLCPGAEELLEGTQLPREGRGDGLARLWRSAGGRAVAGWFGQRGRGGARLACSRMSVFVCCSWESCWLCASSSGSMSSRLRFPLLLAFAVASSPSHSSPSPSPSPFAFVFPPPEVRCESLVTHFIGVVTTERPCTRSRGGRG